MVDDSFIREVNEDVRHEQYQKAWAKYRNIIVGTALAIIIGVGGWKGYEYYSAQQAAKSGDEFTKAIDFSKEGKNSDAVAVLKKLAESGSGQYPALAQMRIAGEYAASGQTKKAITEYDRIAADKGFDQVFRDIATLRAGLLMVDEDTYDKVQAKLQPLAATGKSFRHSARQAIGLSAWKAGEYEDALRWFNEVIEDAEAPAGTRARANVMLDLLAGKGVKTKQEEAASNDG